jgi:hypothetical protein
MAPARRIRCKCERREMRSERNCLWLFVMALAVRLVSSVPIISAADERSCCGPITASGQQLASVLDGMDVEAHWLAHEHVNWQTGDPDRGGENEGPGHTHCSAFAAAAAKRMDIYLLRPPKHGQKLLANAQATWLTSKEGSERGWTPVRDGREAQSLANQGLLVLVAFANPDGEKPGHVAIVRPSEKSARALLRDGPQIVQAGTHNHNSTVVRIGFGNHPGAFPDGVRYYAHPIEAAR